MATALPSDEQLATTALAEIRSPQLAITAQFFEVHRLKDEEPVACVWPVQQGCWWVYLRLEEEPYFWVVIVVQREPGPEVTWGFSSPYSQVYLAVYSESLSPEEITAILKLKPSKVTPKGGLVSPRSRKTADEHRWYYHPACPDSLDFKTKLCKLLSELQASRESFHLLANRAHTVVRASYYDYAGSASGWSLEKEVIANLSSFGLELDFDLYVSGPELPD